MKKFLGLIIVLAVAASPTLAQKITIDYAHDFDFDAVETFAYVETKESDMSNELMDRRIEQAIMDALETSLQRVEKDADIYVTYHMITEDNTVLNTTHMGGYGGWGPGWGGYGRWGWGGGTSYTTATTYTDGTLVIDAYEPAKKQMIWRGTGTVTLKAKPEKQMKQIDNILNKMGNKWQKILASEGK